MPDLCVFASSSQTLNPDLYVLAHQFGKNAALQGWGLVFGGANVGLMEAVARGFHEQKAPITAVIPRIFHEKGLTFHQASEVIVTNDLRERKSLMDARSEAFVTLPGGPGSADELLEIMTLKQIGVHARPILVWNHEGHWNHLKEQLKHMQDNNFCQNPVQDLVTFCDTIPTLLESLGLADQHK